MAKEHWGIKRVCNNSGCGAKFYDFKEKAALCPKCGAAYSQKLMSRSFIKERSASEEDSVDVSLDLAEGEEASSSGSETAADSNTADLEEVESLS